MRRIAVVGSGISGLAAAHALADVARVTLYEAGGHFGGHTHTVDLRLDGVTHGVDTGFLVFNERTYPRLIRLFGELGVDTVAWDMSFSVQHVPTNLEYNGGSLNLLFGQRRNIFRPRHWRMLSAINRFNKEALSGIEDPRYAEMSLRDYVAARGYGEDMLNLYLAPMSSAVWSTPPEKMDEFPATTLLRFWHNHGFLGLDTQHQWWTVCGGAKSYVTKITEPFRDRIQIGRKAAHVVREGGRARIHDDTGDLHEFDKIVLACHGDQALQLLDHPTDLETRLLREFKYQPNTATVHTDTSFMPKTRRCWASWNYRIDPGANGQPIPTTHYWMNRLQGVSDRKNYFVSLNCHDRIAPEKVLRRIEYEHPLFTLGAIRAQRELPALNNISPDQSTYYAGAWFKYGFHEDGFTSGLECARAITRKPIWES